MASKKGIILLLAVLISAAAPAVQLGLDLRGDYLSASVPYSSDGSTGVGFGALIEGRMPLSTDFAVSARTGYAKLRLGRTQSFTTIVTDSNPVQASQSIGYWAFGTDISYRLPGDVCWLDGGLEYLMPLSAAQNDTAAGDISFSSVDKLLFLYLGPSIIFEVDKTMDLRAFTQVAYNLGSQSGSKLLAIRLGLALNMTL